MAKQFFENFPAEIKTAPRFFEVAENKTPKVKEWSNTDNQKTFDKIKGLAGFDTTGHGKGVDYLFFDFDHVLTDTGDFLNDSVSATVADLQATFPNIYIEKSISGHGLHAFLIPTADKFNTLSAGSKATVYFSDSHEKDAPKLELFYKSKARYCLVTGDIYGTGADIPSGEPADDYLNKILNVIASQTKKDSEKKAVVKEIVKEVTNTDTPPEYHRDLAVTLWQFGNLADAGRGDWLPCISALKNLGFSHSEVKSMCEHSARYDENAFDAEFESLTDISNFGIETLIGKCPTFDFKAFARKWYEQHPQFKSNFRRSNNDNDEIKSLFEELEEVEKQLADFDAEKDAAIDSLKNLETFDRDTLFADNVLTAAAFAKIYNRQIFSELKTSVQKFKKSHADTGVALPDFTGAIADFVNSIASRRIELETQRTKIKAKIKTLKFIVSNDILKNFIFPDDYAVDDSGVGKIEGKNVKIICRRPVVVKEKYIAVDEEVTKQILAFKNGIGIWQESKLKPRAEIFNARELVKIANDDFPFTSQNAGGIVDYLDAFLALNENNLPITYTFKNFGYHELKGKKIFLDPRRNNTIEVDGENLKVCCTSNSQFARALKSVGNLNQWQQIYNKVKKYPVARFTVAAAVAAPLLEILGERGFWIHTHTKTRSGKSTALKFATSAVGKPDGVLKNFNATINGLQGVAAEYNGFSFPIDEWQAASEKLKSQVSNLIHNLIDGTARTKMNKDSTVRENENWLTIVLTNGETVLLNDNALGGEFTRVLNIAAPAPILPPELCKEIHNTVKNHYGLVFPLILSQFENFGNDKLREMYADFCDSYTEEYSAQKGILQEYCRYISVVSVADVILNVALGDNLESAVDAATDTAKEIFELIPTISEIDDSTRAQEMILGFIAKYSAHFAGMENYEPKYGRDTYGKIGGVGDNYFYITDDATKTACQENNFDYRKTVQDLIGNGFFIPADNIEKGRKKPRPSVKSGINGVNARCYRIIKENVIND